MLKHSLVHAIKSWGFANETSVHKNLFDHLQQCSRKMNECQLSPIFVGEKEMIKLHVPGKHRWWNLGVGYDPKKQIKYSPCGKWQSSPRTKNVQQVKSHFKIMLNAAFMLIGGFVMSLSLEKRVEFKKTVLPHFCNAVYRHLPKKQCTRI